MLSKKIEKALNDQIATEANASYYYLALASWCDKEGLNGSAGFLYGQSVEEREHMLKLFKYINEAGGHALAPEIKKPPHQYGSMEKIFEGALKRELNTTKEINKLVDQCLKEKDYSTSNFLQWYVTEQHEEEALFRSILDKINLIGVDGKGIYFIDKEIGSMGGQE